MTCCSLLRSWGADVLSIGLTRWFVSATETRLGGGRIRWTLTLTPQARTYVVQNGNGWSHYFTDKRVHTRPFSVENYGTVMTTEALKAEIVQRLANELSWEVVRWCSNLGIVDGDLGIPALCVYAALLAAVQEQRYDEIEQVDEISLTQLMEQRRDQINQARIHSRVRDEDYEAASRVAFDLLTSWLTPEEKEEAATKSVITVNNRLGRFVIPVGPGKVTRYVDDKPEAQYCMIFKDHDIPVGDEVLMKLVLLKSDPERFLQEANRFGY